MRGYRMKEPPATADIGNITHSRVLGHFFKLEKAVQSDLLSLFLYQSLSLSLCLCECVSVCVCVMHATRHIN